MSEKTLPLEEPKGQHLQLLRPDQPSQLRFLPHDILFSLPRLLHLPPFPILPLSLLDLLLLLPLFWSLLPLLLPPFTLAFLWKSMPCAVVPSPLKRRIVDAGTTFACTVPNLVMASSIVPSNKPTIWRV